MTDTMTGFNNHFATEAIPGALPIGRNSPQKPPFGLYAEQLSGSAFTAPGPKLIEYTARFGDPETQVLMMRFEGDLIATMLAVAEGRLADLPPARFSAATALTVVMAAQGYPGTPKAGGAIIGLDSARAAGGTVFHAGTRLEDGGLVAAGGRVLAVTATGDDLASAQANAYRAVEAIDFAEGFYRRDIGWRELTR